MVDKPIITVVVFDGGYKESAPVLKCLSEQTILDEVEVYWIDYFDKIFTEVHKYDFVKRVCLNNADKFHVGYCLNAGLALSNAPIFMVLDPCLEIPSDALEKIGKVHTENSNPIITFCTERRQTPQGFRTYITNYGCMPTFSTEASKAINGFDLFSYPYGATAGRNNPWDRPTPGNHTYRYCNKYGVLPRLLSIGATHMMHPVSEEIVDVAFNRMTDEYYGFSIEGPTVAYGGLVYFNDVYTQSVENDTIMFHKKW